MVSVTINVSELKCACLDEAWLKQWVSGEKPPTFTVTGGLPYQVHGTKFHQLADQFVRWLAGNHKNAPTAYDDLWGALWDHFAQNQINKLLEDNADLRSVHHLVACLKSFYHRLEALNQSYKVKKWNEIFIVQEFSIDAVPFSINGDTVIISGRVDAVRMNLKNGLDIVDYKLTHANHLEKDLLQIAIYSQLLKATKPGLTFHGILEYYGPEMNEKVVDEEELDRLFQEQVKPVLTTLVQKVKEFKGKDYSPPTLPTIPPKPEPKPAPPKVIVAENGVAQQIVDCFASFKLEVEVIGVIEGPQLLRYQLKPGAGVKAVSLANRADDLMVQLQLPCSPNIHPQQGYIAVDVPKEKAEIVYLEEVLKDPRLQSHPSPLAFPVGVNIKNELIIADLAETNTCHALVGGMTGSGKSEFLKSVIYTFVTRNTPSTLQFLLIDPKLLTFNVFKNIPYLRQPLVHDLEQSIECLQDIAEEMETRYQQLSNEGYDNLSQRHRDGKTDIPFTVIVIDEFGDLIVSDKDLKKEFERLITKLAQKGRAAGIHLILATQHPVVKIVTGPIKANLPLKICLRVNNQTNSNVVLDEGGGQNLVGKGDLLCDLGKGTERAQSPFIPTDVLQDRLKQLH